MQVRVKYFASLREVLGPQELLELPSSLRTVADLRDHLLARGGRYAEVLTRGRAVRCAVDQRMCAETEVLQPGAEVAFFPPVTGG